MGYKSTITWQEACSTLLYGFMGGIFGAILGVVFELCLGVVGWKTGFFVGYLLSITEEFHIIHYHSQG